MPCSADALLASAACHDSAVSRSVPHVLFVGQAVKASSTCCPVHVSPSVCLRLVELKLQLRLCGCMSVWRVVVFVVVVAWRARSGEEVAVVVCGGLCNPPALVYRSLLCCQVRHGMLGWLQVAFAPASLCGVCEDVSSLVVVFSFAILYRCFVSSRRMCAFGVGCGDVRRVREGSFRVAAARLLVPRRRAPANVVRSL